MFNFFKVLLILVMFQILILFCGKQSVNCRLFNRFRQNQVYRQQPNNGVIIIGDRKKSKNHDLIIIHPSYFPDDHKHQWNNGLRGPISSIFNRPRPFSSRPLFG